MHRQRAFTLIELSIVLVIIGLLVGGVLVGRDLIKAAELRSVITQKGRFATAINTFRGKYDALPGDMANATDYWGAQDPTPATCIATASTTSLTCNGNGDGKIGYENSTTDTWEGFRVWQHLANAGIVVGKYSGVAGYVPKINIPDSDFSANAAWNLWYFPGRTVWGWSPEAPGHYLVFSIAVGGWWVNPVLKPSDELSIDKKIDDGRPYLGAVNNINAGHMPNCSTSESIDGEYDLAYKGVACLLFFKAF